MAVVPGLPAHLGSGPADWQLSELGWKVLASLKTDPFPLYQNLSQPGEAAQESRAKNGCAKQPPQAHIDCKGG